MTTYRENTGEKLFAPSELLQKLQQEILVRQQAEERAQQAELQVKILKEKLKALGVDPDISH